MHKNQGEVVSIRKRTADIITRDRAQEPGGKINEPDTCFHEAMIDTFRSLFPSKALSRNNIAFLNSLERPSSSELINHISMVGEKLNFRITGASIPSIVSNSEEVRDILKLDGIPTSTFQIEQGRFSKSLVFMCPPIGEEIGHLLSTNPNPLFPPFHSGQDNYNHFKKEGFEDAVILHLVQTV